MSQPTGLLIFVQDKATGHTVARLYTSVVVANGHHWNAAWPELPGTFTGTLMHSHEYRTPKSMEGKRLMVIGAGNSGVLACVFQSLQHSMNSNHPCACKPASSECIASDEAAQTGCMHGSMYMCPFETPGARTGECNLHTLGHSLFTRMHNMNKSNMCNLPTRDGHCQRGVPVRGCSGVSVLPAAGACGSPAHIWQAIRLDAAGLAGRHCASQAAGNRRHLHDQALKGLPGQLQVPPAQVWPAAGEVLASWHDSALSSKNDAARAHSGLVGPLTLQGALLQPTDLQLKTPR